MIAPGERLPVVTHAAASAVIQAALDQPNPSPALRTALAEFLQVSTDAVSITERIPLGVWTVLREQEKVTALLRVVGRAVTVPEVHRATGVCVQNVRAALAGLTRSGLVEVLSGAGQRRFYRMRPDAPAPRVVTRRYRVVIYLLERGPSTVSEVAAFALQGPQQNRSRLARHTLEALTAKGVAAPFTDDSGVTYWDLTAHARHTNYVPPTDAQPDNPAPARDPGH